MAVQSLLSKLENPQDGQGWLDARWLRRPRENSNIYVGKVVSYRLNWFSFLPFLSSPFWFVCLLVRRSRFQSRYATPFSANRRLWEELLIWRQKWVAGVRRGNSIVARRVSPGRTKYANLRQIESGILQLSIRRGLHSAANNPRPQMIPRPEMIPNWAANDP